MIGSHAWHACFGKRQWLTYAKAEKAATMSKRRDFPIVVYRCRYCQHWHVGSTEWKLRRVERRQNRPIRVEEDA